MWVDLLADQAGAALGGMPIAVLLSAIVSCIAMAPVKVVYGNNASCTDISMDILIFMHEAQHANSSCKCQDTVVLSYLSALGLGYLFLPQSAPCTPL